jgi:glycosyltransferase involved in cell wall biosynthesis
MMSEIDISIILPVRNEEESIGKLLQEIFAVIQNHVRKPTEIIVVDDASDDSSGKVVRTIADELGSSEEEKSSMNNPELRLIRLNARSGQARALMKGFAEAKGALIMSMDSDGQHDPADIPRFIRKADAFDMICGIRCGRSDGFARLLCSKAANFFRNLITGGMIKDAGCTFRLMRKECFPVVNRFADKLLGCDYFFHPLFVHSSGFRVGEITVTHRKRAGGKSNYRLLRGRFFRGAFACFRAVRYKNRLRRRAGSHGNS